MFDLFDHELQHEELGLNEKIASLESQIKKSLESSRDWSSSATGVLSVNNLLPDSRGNVTIVAGGGSGTVQSIVAGTNVTVDSTDPANPIVSAAGNVAGPGSATDNAIARFDLATGKLIQNSTVLLSDAGAITGATSITLSSLTATRGVWTGSGGILQTTGAWTYDGTSMGISPGRLTIANTDGANYTLSVSHTGGTVTRNGLLVSTTGSSANTNALKVDTGTITNALLIYGSGNSAFGTTPIAANRLVIQGSGATSSTGTLLVQNSSAARLIQTYDNQTIRMDTRVAVNSDPNAGNAANTSLYVLRTDSSAITTSSYAARYDYTIANSVNSTSFPAAFRADITVSAGASTVDYAGGALLNVLIANLHTGAVAQAAAMEANLRHSGQADIPVARGGVFSSGFFSTGATGTITENRAGTFTAFNVDSAGAVVNNTAGYFETRAPLGGITTNIALDVRSPSASVTRTIGTNYGIYVRAQNTTGITTSYGLYFAGTEAAVSAGIAFRNGNISLYANAAGVLRTNASIYTEGSIEIGDASDTTLSRSSAGVLAVEGVVVPTISSTNTLTNKRITKRVTAITSSATPTINTDNCDAVDITALATAITDMSANLSGTPSNKDTLVFQIKDDGTAHAISWGSAFVAGGVALPTTTVISKILTVGFIYNTANALNKWQCIASSQEA